jgi:lipopolysaccharide export system permease protein
MLVLFIPIGITIDVSEKVNKMIEKKVPFKDILVYYGDFTIYFANLLFPIFLQAHLKLLVLLLVIHV